MPLTFCVTLAVLAFDAARRHQGAGRFVRLLAGYVALAAGVLLKGPVGLVLPAAVVGVQRLVEGELPPPWRLRDCGRLAHALGVWWGLPLTLGLTVPWFVWADLRTGGAFGRVFFWHHNVARGLGGEALRSHPWYQYVGFAAVYLLPWTPFVPVAAWLTWRRGLWRLSPDVRLGVVWFLTVFALLSCARFKRADYLVPAYPGAALFLGAVFSAWWRGCRNEASGGVYPRRLPAAGINPAARLAPKSPCPPRSRAATTAASPPSSAPRRRRRSRSSSSGPRPTPWPSARDGR